MSLYCISDNALHGILPMVNNLLKIDFFLKTYFYYAY